MLWRSLLVLSLLAAGCAAPSSNDEDLDPLDEAESEVTATPQKVPAFTAMWNAYPNGGAEQVKDLIGGAVDADWITNTCTIRMSRALNYADAPVPRGPSMDAAGLHTVTGSDKKNYGFRVAEFRNYLRKTYGAPTLDVTTETTMGVDPARFANKKGIIVFEVHTWTDATGHADLWNGTEPAHAAYFELASRVQLWSAD
jgi:hypothetical protein